MFKLNVLCEKGEVFQGKTLMSRHTLIYDDASCVRCLQPYFVESLGAVQEYNNLVLCRDWSI